MCVAELLKSNEGKHHTNIHIVWIDGYQLYHIYCAILAKMQIYSNDNCSVKFLLDHFFA